MASFLMPHWPWLISMNVRVIWRKLLKCTLPFKSGVHRVILFACSFCNERLLKCTERTHCTAGLHTKLGSLLQKLKRYSDAMEHFRLALRFGLVWLGATNHMTTLYVLRPCSSHYGWGGRGGGGEVQVFKQVI